MWSVIAMMLALGLALLLVSVEGFAPSRHSGGWGQQSLLLRSAVAHPERLASILREHEEMLSAGADGRRFKELDTIVRCVRALEEIERDLVLMEEHIAGEDVKLRDTALTFKSEFLQCSGDIESQLNILLSQDPSSGDAE